MPDPDVSDPADQLAWDWTAEPSPNGPRVNMGACGGTVTASKTCEGDAALPVVVDMEPEPGSAEAVSLTEISVWFDDYEIHGIEIGISGDRMAFRIRTDFDPRNRGGDVFIEVDDTLSAVAVSNRILPDGRQITAGNLYLDVDPLPGEVVPWDYRINDWETELAGYSGIPVIDDVITWLPRGKLTE